MPAGDDLGVGGQPLDEAGDPGQLVGVVERAEVGVGHVEAAGRRVAAACSASAATKSSWTPRAGEHPGGGGAVLAGVEVAGHRDALGGRGEVGVVEDDDRRLAAELEVHPLEVAAAAASATSMPARTLPVIDTICGIGCDDQRPAGVAVAADDVEHARRQELGHDLGHQQRR